MGHRRQRIEEVADLGLEPPPMQAPAQLAGRPSCPWPTRHSGSGHDRHADLRALGDRRRLRPARVLRGAGNLPGPGRGRLMGSGPSAQGSRLGGCASACLRRSATRAGSSRTSAPTSMPAASIVLRSTSSSSLRSNPDAGRSVSMSLLMRPSVPRRCAARARFRRSRHRRRDRPESRGLRGARRAAATTKRRCRARRGARRHAHRRRGRARLGPGGLVVARPDRRGVR